jgi:HAD superfamily hydrolase (TIGR01509 family)
LSRGSARNAFDVVFAGATGVIFDLNGVLVEDEPLHEAAFAEVLARYNIALTHDAYQATLLGQTDENGVIRLAAAAGRHLPVAEVVQAKAQLYREKLRTESSGYTVAGARPLVEALAARGMRLSIASASPAVEVYNWLDILGLRHRFDPVVTRENSPESKPHPAVFEAICACWRISAATCVVLDDHPENIAIAHTLGMRPVGIASTLPAAAFEHAALVVGTLADLLPD